MWPQAACKATFPTCIAGEFFLYEYAMEHTFGAHEAGAQSAGTRQREKQREKKDSHFTELLATLNTAHTLTQFDFEKIVLYSCVTKQIELVHICVYRVADSVSCGNCFYCVACLVRHRYISTSSSTAPKCVALARLPCVFERRRCVWPVMSLRRCCLSLGCGYCRFVLCDQFLFSVANGYIYYIVDEAKEANGKKNWLYSWQLQF